MRRFGIDLTDTDVDALNRTDRTGTMTSNDTTSEPLEGLKVAALATATGLTVAISLTLNLYILYLFLIEKKLRTAGNSFYISLAVADVIISVNSMIFYGAYLILGYWPFGEVWCDLWLSLDYGCCQVSVMTLVIISIDRYLSISKPVDHLHRSTVKTGLMVGAPWVLSLFICPVPFISWQFIVGERTVPGDACYVQFLDSIIPTVISSVGYYWLPLLIILIFYFRVYTIAKKFRRVTPRNSMLGAESSAGGANRPGSRAQDPGPHEEGGGPSDDPAESAANHSTEPVIPPEDSPPARPKIVSIAAVTKPSSQAARKTQASRSAKALASLTGIVLAFVVTWTLWATLVIADAMCVELTGVFCVNSQLFGFSYFLCYINSLLNPLCYPLANPHIKKAFLSRLPCRIGQSKLFGRRRSAVAT